MITVHKRYRRTDRRTDGMQSHNRAVRSIDCAVIKMVQAEQELAYSSRLRIDRYHRKKGHTTL